MASIPWHLLSFGRSPTLLRSHPKNFKLLAMIEVFCALSLIPCRSNASSNFDIHCSPSIILLYWDPIPLLVNPCKMSSTYADPRHLCFVLNIGTPSHGSGKVSGICPSLLGYSFSARSIYLVICTRSKLPIQVHIFSMSSTESAKCLLLFLPRLNLVRSIGFPCSMRT